MFGREAFFGVCLKKDLESLLWKRYIGNLKNPSGTKYIDGASMGRKVSAARAVYKSPGFGALNLKQDLGLGPRKKGEKAKGSGFDFKRVSNCLIFSCRSKNEVSPYLSLKDLVNSLYLMTGYDVILIRV